MKSKSERRYKAVEIMIHSSVVLISMVAIVATLLLSVPKPLSGLFYLITSIISVSFLISGSLLLCWCVINGMDYIEYPKNLKYEKVRITWYIAVGLILGASMGICSQYLLSILS